jgi:hypothetical protein
MTLRTEATDRDVRTRSAASRVDLGTRYVTVYVVSLVAGRSEGKRDNDNKLYTMRRMVLNYRVERVSNDPVLSSLKMEGILCLFFYHSRKFCDVSSTTFYPRFVFEARWGYVFPFPMHK